MEKNLKRSKEEVGVELPAKQSKLEENEEEKDEEKEEQPAVEFLEPHLACEIYSALPAVHQRQLLTLCRDIYELGPSTDGWKRWMNLRWIGNKWNVNDCGRGIDLSPDGLAISRDNRVWQPNEYANIVRAILPAFPPVTTNQPTQFCYFEAKYLRGFSSIGFFGGDVDLHASWISPDRFGIYCSCIVFPGNWYTPNVCLRDDVIGCGLIKHMNKRRIFFTKNGELLASVPIPSNAPNLLFPAVAINDYPYPYSRERFTDTNFGSKPFRFKYAGNEEKLLNGLGRDFEKEAA